MTAQRRYQDEYTSRSDPIFELPHEQRGKPLDALRAELTKTHVAPAVSAVEAAMRSEVGVL